MVTNKDSASVMDWKGLPLNQSDLWTKQHLTYKVQ